MTTYIPKEYPTHYFLARTPEGQLHGSSVDVPCCADSFRRLHEGLGCTVSRVTAAELAEMVKPKRNA